MPDIKAIRGKLMKLRRIKVVQEPAHVRNKRKRGLQRILSTMWFVLVTVLFVITIIYASMSPFFNIKQIVSEGSAHYDGAVLAAASSIRPGRNGFKLMFESSSFSGVMRISDAERSIMSNCPYVKQARVGYVLPSTIHIEVVEREPAAIIDMKGTYLLIDREGYLLEIEPATDRLSLPVIRTTQLATANLGNKLDIPDEMFLSAFKVFDTIKDVDSANECKLIDDVDYVDPCDPYNVKISLESRIIVNLGKAEDLHYKISATTSILRKNLKKTERGTLDFSANTDPVFTPEYGG
jgi:cell division protein FtsQ